MSLLNSTPIDGCHKENSIADIQLFSQALKACGDPLRVQILQVLRYDTFGVMELTQLFNTKQSGMSHHLKILANADLVITRREGNSIFYRRSYQRDYENPDAALNTLQLALHGAIDQRPLSTDIQQRVKLVQDERAARSQEFFNENANPRIKENQCWH